MCLRATSSVGKSADLFSDSFVPQHSAHRAEQTSCCRCSLNSETEAAEFEKLSAQRAKLPERVGVPVTRYLMSFLYLFLISREKVVRNQLTVCQKEEKSLIRNTNKIGRRSLI